MLEFKSVILMKAIDCDNFTKTNEYVYKKDDVLLRMH